MTQHKILYTFFEFSKKNYYKNLIFGKAITLILIKNFSYSIDRPFQSFLSNYLFQSILSLSYFISNFFKLHN